MLFFCLFVLEMGTHAAAQTGLEHSCLDDRHELSLPLSCSVQCTVRNSRKYSQLLAAATQTRDLGFLQHSRGFRGQ